MNNLLDASLTKLKINNNNVDIVFGFLNKIYKNIQFEIGDRCPKIVNEYYINVNYPEYDTSDNVFFVFKNEDIKDLPLNDAIDAYKKPSDIVDFMVYEINKFRKKEEYTDLFKYFDEYFSDEAKSFLKYF